MARSQADNPTRQRTPHTPQLGPLVHELLRTETVVSRLPLHNLGKRGLVDISLVRTDAQGHITLRWDVAYSRKYGDARQLAYKLDTLVINRRLDAHGRPVPKLLKLGSLRQMAAELRCGRNTAPVKEALRQNAFTGITAYVCYTDRDGRARTLEGSFTRYAVWFTGDALPDGRRADAVYLQFHDPYWELLNHAPVRPLDYPYLRRLAPGVQRLYELLSYHMFAVLKHRRPCATMRYSEYCLFAPQERYHTYDRMKKQMYKLHRPHIDAGYLLPPVQCEATVDAAGAPDWLMRYTPGPKARAEYAVYTRQRRGAAASLEATDAAEPREQEGWTSSPGGLPTPGHAEAVALVQAFYQRFHQIAHASPSAKAIEQAAALLAHHGPDRAYFVLDYAYQATQRTGFRPDHFGGIQPYLPHALAAFAHRQQRAAQQHITVAAARRHDQYTAYYAAAVAQCKARMTPAELTALSQGIERRVIAEGTTPRLTLTLAVKIGMDEALAQRAGVLSFEAWCQQHGEA